MTLGIHGLSTKGIYFITASVLECLAESIYTGQGDNCKYVIGTSNVSTSPVEECCAHYDSSFICWVRRSEDLCIERWRS